MDTPDNKIIHILHGMEQNSSKFHYATQNWAQLSITDNVFVKFSALYFWFLTGCE